MTRLTLPLVAVSAYLLGRFVERAWWMADRPVREPDAMQQVQENDPWATRGLKWVDNLGVLHVIPNNLSKEMH